MRRVAPLVLCVLVLGACAGDDDSERSPASSVGAATTSAESPEATLASAVDRVQSETATFELDASIASAGGSVDVTGEGTVDFEADRSRTTLDMSELLALGGQGSPADWRGEAINIGDVIYMRLPGLTKALPQEVEWLKVDAGTLAEQGGTQFNAPDPGQFVTFATAMAEGADEVGSEEIRGSDTTHYRGTVAVEDIVAAAPP
jgi:hypothetical protein